MAFELYGMLAGNVSPMTGENIKPAYGGDNEAFLRKVVTPIYHTIAKVWFMCPMCWVCLPCAWLWYIVYCRKLSGAREKNQNIHNGGIMMI